MTLSRLENARRELDQARAALSAGLADLAAAHIKASLEHCPDLAAARLTEARLCLLRDQPWRALAALDCLDLYHPQQRDQPQTQFLRAEALIRAGCDQPAADLLARLCEQYPDDVRAHRLAGGLDLKLGRIETAINHLRRVQHLEPSDQASRRLLTELLSQRDPQGAIDVLSTPGQPASDQDAGATRLAVARLCRRAGRERDAEELYAALLREEGGDPSLWTEAGVLADDLGDDRLAVARLECALKSAPSPSPQALAALARAHQHAGRTGPAVRCWFRAARLHDTGASVPAADSLEARAGLLVGALEAGRDRLLRRAQKDLAGHSSPQERRRLLALHWCHTALGRVIRNQHAARALPQQGPLAGLLGKSIQTLRTHAGQFPRRCDTQYHLALCLEAAQDYGGARQAVDAALQINAHYAAAQRLAARLNPQPEPARAAGVDSAPRLAA